MIITLLLYLLKNTCNKAKILLALFIPFCCYIPVIWAKYSKNVLITLIE